MGCSDWYFSTKNLGISKVNFCRRTDFNLSAYLYCNKTGNIIDVMGNIPEDVYNVCNISKFKLSDEDYKAYFDTHELILKTVRDELKEKSLPLSDAYVDKHSDLLTALYLLLHSLCYVVYTKDGVSGYATALVTKNETIINDLIESDYNPLTKVMYNKHFRHTLDCCSVTSEELESGVLKAVEVKVDPDDGVFCHEEIEIPLDADECYIVPYYMMRLRFNHILSKIGRDITVITYKRDNRIERIDTCFDDHYEFDYTLQSGEYDCSKIKLKDYITGLGETINLLEIMEIISSEPKVRFTR